jgi:hypothetical protein
MRVLAYIPLHYGKEYLSEAIKSIHDSVEKIIILYTDKPSFGYSTGLPCPDTREEMFHQAKNTSHKVEWIEIAAGKEGEHRELIHYYSHGYDLIVTVDADEIWSGEDLKRCLKQAYESHERNYGIAGFVNFYRSFNTVCIDHFTPIRIIKPSGIAGTMKVLNGTIYHFGYAQRNEVMRYKWSCHGHRDELRNGWMEHKYFGYVTGMTDLHPVAAGIWNPISFDKNTLPDFLKQHPNFNKEIIE